MNHNDQFYKKLFTRNRKWSGALPNKDESARWSIIERFAYFVRGYRVAKQLDGMDILDLGCGRGWLTNLLSTHGNVKGIEPVKPVVDYANQLFPDLKISRATSDDLLLTHNVGKFNLIVSSEVIEHVEDKDKQKFVSNIAKLLTSDGFCIITTPRKEIEATFLKYSKLNQPIESWISEKDLEALFVQNGFSPVFRDRIAFRPRNRYHPFAPLMEIYQLWLFQKTKDDSLIPR